MKLTLQEIDPAGIARVFGEGEITIHDFADPGKNPLEKVLGANWATCRVLLGMEKIEFIDSSAIGWMIDSNRRFRDKGGRLVWYAPTPRVKDMIDLLKMRQFLDIYETEADARKVLDGGAAKPAVAAAATDPGGRS
jgi:anti-anti-sigma factor